MSTANDRDLVLGAIRNNVGEDDALYTYTNNLANNSEALDNYGKSLKDVTGLQSQFTTSMSATAKAASGIGTTFGKVTSVIKSFAATMGNMLITMAASWFIGKAFEVFNDIQHYSENLIKAGEEAKEKIDEYAKSVKETQDTINDLGKTYGSNPDEIETEFDSIDQLAEKYTKLREGTSKDSSNSNVSLSTDEYQNYLDISNKLAELYPSLVSGVDKNGNAILKLGDNASRSASQLRDLYTSSVLASHIDIYGNMSDVYSGTSEQIKQYENDRKNYENEKKELQAQYDKLDNATNKHIAKKGNNIITSKNEDGFLVEEEASLEKAVADYNSKNKNANLEVVVLPGNKEAQISGLENLSTEQIADFNEIYYKYINSYLNDIKKQTGADLSNKNEELNSVDKNIEAEYGKRTSTVTDWIETSEEFFDLNSTVRNAMLAHIREMDPSVVEDEFGNSLEQFGYEAFLEPLHNLSEDTQEKLADALDLDFSDLSKEDYQEKMTEVLSLISPDEKVQTQWANILGITSNLETYDDNMKRLKKALPDSKDLFDNWDYEDLSLASQAIDEGFDISEGYEALLKKVVEMKKYKASLKGDTTLASILSDSDNEVSSSIDTLQSDISSLSATLQSLKTGDFKETDLTDLIQQFPQLTGETDNLQEAIANLQADKLKTTLAKIDDAMADASTEEKAKAQELKDSLIKSADLSDISASDVTNLIYKAFNDKEGSKKIAAINGRKTAQSFLESFGTAMQTGTGREALYKALLDFNITNGNIKNLSYEQYLPTAKDVIQDENLQSQLTTYQDEYQALYQAQKDVKNGLMTGSTRKTFLDKFPDLAKYADNTDDLSSAIDNLMDSMDNNVALDFADKIQALKNEGRDADASALQAYVNSIIDGAHDIEGAYKKIAGLKFKTPQFEAANDAASSENGGKTYEDMLSLYNSAKELYDKGMIGTDDFKTVAAMFSPTGSDDYTNFTENMPKIERYFTEGSDGCINFLNDLQALGLAEQEGDKWTYTLGNSMEELHETADKLGIGFEPLMSMFGRLEDYDFYNDFFTTEEAGTEKISDLYSQLAAEKMHLAQIKANPDTADYDTAVAESEKKIAEFEERIKNANENMDELLNKKGKYSEETLNYAKSVAQSMIDEINNTDDAQLKEVLQKQLDTFAKNYHLIIDVNGNITTLEEQIDTIEPDIKIDLSATGDDLNSEIDDLSKYLQLLRSDSDVDVNTDKISAAQTILETLIEKKQQLEAPAVMNISTDQLSGMDSNIQSAITAIQEYQKAANELEKQKSLGLDTTEAKKAVDDAKKELDSIDPETKKTLNFDIKGLDDNGIVDAIKNLNLDVFNNDIQNLQYKFNITNDEEARKWIDDFSNLTEGTKNIDVEIRLSGVSRENINLIDSLIAQGQASNPSLTVSVNKVTPITTKELLNESAIGTAAGLGPANVSVKLNKSDFDQGIKEVESKGEELSKKTYAPELKVTDHATSIISQISHDINALQPQKTIDIIVNRVNNVTTNTTTNTDKAPKATGTMLRVAHADGTAYNVLNYTPAHADGSVTLSHDETALVNEEGYGAESIVRNGKWMIIPGGAHFENLKKGDLIFNKRQTSELINSGRVISGGGHARAYAGGTTTGAGNLWGLNQGKSGSSATDKNTNATNKNTDATNDNTDATKKSSKVWDWVEKRITWWGDQVKKISDKITDYIDKSIKRSLLKQQIGKMNYQIKSNEKGAKAYMKKANEVANKYTYYNSDGTAIETNVPKKYQKLVQKGAYRIEDMDTSTDAGKAQAEAIEQYQTWYEKAKACKQAVVDLKKEQMELFEQWANMPTEEAEQALERLQNGFNGINATQARLSAAQTGGSTQAAIVAQTKAPYEAAEEARQAASTRLDTAKENAENANKAVSDTRRNLLKSKGLTDEQKKAINAGKKINTSKIKNKTTKRRAEAYNKAVTAKDKATNKQKTAQTAYNKANTKASILQPDATEATKGYNDGNELSYMDAMTDENVSNMQKAANINNQAWIETKKNLNTYTKAKEKANKDVKKKSDSIIAKYGKKLSAGQKKKLAAGEEIKVDNIKDPKLKSALTTYNKLVSKADDVTQKFNITTDAEKTAAANAAEAQTEAAKAVVQATQDKFDNAKTYYEGLLGYQEKLNSLDDAEIDRYNAHGNYERSSDYDTKINNTKASKAIKQNEVAELENRLNEGVANGTIKEGSQEWINMKSEIVDAKKAVADYDTTIENLKQQQIGVYYAEQFDRAIEKINQFKDRLDTLKGIISDDMKIDKNTGLLTEWGAASILLNRNQFTANQSEMQTLLEKENDVKRRYANGEDMSSEFGGKTYDEYMKDIQSQKNSLISSNASLQNEMLTLIKNQAQAELDALNKVINKRKEALSAKKEYYDYDKTLKNKTKDIQILERQIAALEGSTNAEDKARKAKLQEQLADAQDSLTDTITDHAYSMQSEALEKLSSDMSDDFEKWSNDISSNVEKMTEAINGAVTNSGMNTVKVVGSLKTILKNFGLTDDQITTVIPDNLTGYASGTDYVPKSGIYRTNENGMESVLSKKYGTLTFLNQGDKVFTADFTQSLLNNAVVATQSSQPQFGEMYKEFMNAINNVNNQSVEHSTVYNIIVNEATDANAVGDIVVKKIDAYEKKRVRDYRSLK